MYFSVIKRFLSPFVALGIGLTSNAALARDAIVLSKVLQVCVRGVPGVKVAPKQGIDAVEGKVASKGGFIDFMISSNPNLPAGMNIKPDKSSVISRQLTSDLQLIAKSTGTLQMGMEGHPIGHGTERLYAFDKGDLSTPVGPIQDQVFVQLWSDGNRRNDRLVKTVGDGLYRCH